MRSLELVEMKDTLKKALKEEQKEEVEVERLWLEDQEKDDANDCTPSSSYESSSHFNCFWKKIAYVSFIATISIGFFFAINFHSFKSDFYIFHTSTNDFPICSIQPQSCPDQYAYKPSCKILAMHQAIHDEGHLSLPKLRDPSNFVSDLITFFHGKRIALVGDSLTRQWFETLSCRLGLKQTWFRKTESLKKLPPHLALAKNKNNVTFTNVNHGPRHMKSGHYLGYATSSNQFSSTSKLGKFQDSSACQPFFTNIEYYHLELLQEQTSDTKSLVEFISNVSDVMIFNVGAHYADEKQIHNLDRDLQTLLEICGTYNTNTSISRCFFRETLPAHFQFKDKPCGEYNFEDKAIACGPTDPNLISPFNQNLDICGKRFNVPIIKASMLQPAWRWHGHIPSGHKPDCRHYCQDNLVWDLLHESLLQTAKDCIS